MYLRLTVLLVVLTSAWGEPVAEHRARSLLESVLRHAEGLLTTARKLPEIRQTVSKVFLGLPLELGITLRDGVYKGPAKIVPVGVVRGIRSERDTLFIQAEVELRDVEIDYGYVQIDFFGHKYEGKAEIVPYLMRGVLNLSISKEDIVNGCWNTTSTIHVTTKGYGFNIGTPGTFVWYLPRILELIFNHIDFEIPSDNFLPSMSDPIMEAINSFRLNCKSS